MIEHGCGFGKKSEHVVGITDKKLFKINFGVKNFNP